MKKAHKWPKPTYEGCLKTKIEIPSPPKLPSQALEFFDPELMKSYNEELEEYQQKTYEFFRKEQMKKIRHLYKHYEIDPQEEDAHSKLIILLAGGHVPGFQPFIKAKIGRPKGWDELTLAKLFFDVEELFLVNDKKEKGCPKYHRTDACRTLIRREPWKTLVQAKNEEGSKSKVLENKYLEAKKSSMVLGYLKFIKEKKSYYLSSAIKELVTLCYPEK